ncbi:MAG: hypothetical protein C0443_10735 [Comamonadaceae bacterium]|nr:hypothetical protein [Comamonadaceae bacterium]
MVALLVPSGIAADKGASAFFRSISGTGRLGALFDFENRKGFFPDVDSRFKFCTLVFGGAKRTFAQSRCAFYLHRIDELEDARRTLSLSADDFVRVNPNTGAAPIFRNRRDADITLKLYANHPVLVRHGGFSESLGQLPDQRAWPVKYVTMFHMTNDSKLFLKPAEMKKEGWSPAALNRWTKDGKEAVPLYEGKMVQMFDHRAADVVVNEANLKRAAQQESISQLEKANVNRYPIPQYHVTTEDVNASWAGEWCIAYKSVTAPSNMRTMIGALIPKAGVGNSMAMLIPEDPTDASFKAWAPLLAANFFTFAFDFALRQKVQGQNLNWFIIEQATVIAPERFEKQIGTQNIADFIRQQVLVLTYTAHDMAPFARDMGHVDAQGEVLPPFVWDEEDRRSRMASLDALFFHLYGIDAKDAAYILDTFPIVREQDMKLFGRYRTQEDILAKLKAIEGGQLA